MYEWDNVPPLVSGGQEPSDEKLNEQLNITIRDFIYIHTLIEHSPDIRRCQWSDQPDNMRGTATDGIGSASDHIRSQPDTGPESPAGLANSDENQLLGFSPRSSNSPTPRAFSDNDDDVDQEPAPPTPARNNLTSSSTDIVILNQVSAQQAANPFDNTMPRASAPGAEQREDKKNGTRSKGQGPNKNSKNAFCCDAYMPFSLCYVCVMFYILLYCYTGLYWGRGFFIGGNLPVFLLFRLFSIFYCHLRRRRGQLDERSKEGQI